MDKPLQLMQLARVFPEKLVSKLQKKTHSEDYINHSVITQRLLQVCGPFDWDGAESNPARRCQVCRWSETGGHCRPDIASVSFPE